MTLRLRYRTLKLRALATPRAAGHKSVLLTMYLNGCPSPLTPRAYPSRGAYLSAGRAPHLQACGRGHFAS